MRRGGGRRDQRRNRGKGQGRGTEDLDQGRTICLENTPAENPYLGPGTVAPSQGRGDRDPTRGRTAGGPGLIPGIGGRGRGKGEGPEKGEEGPGTDQTLPKAQWTRGLSSSFQSNLLSHITSTNTNLDQTSCSLFLEYI